MAEDECQGCRNGLLPKELSVKEWHDEYLKLAIYAVSLANENTKLREERRKYQATIDSLVDECADHKTENSKLRELLLDVADVLEKNAKLHELAERLRSAVSDGADNARDVLADNAKLRKLLLDVWNDAIRFDGFWDYVHDDGTIYSKDELPHYVEKLRELGVEASHDA